MVSTLGNRLTKLFLIVTLLLTQGALASINIVNPSDNDKSFESVLSRNLSTIDSSGSEVIEVIVGKKALESAIASGTIDVNKHTFIVAINSYDFKAAIAGLPDHLTKNLIPIYREADPVAQAIFSEQVIGPKNKLVFLASDITEEYAQNLDAFNITSFNTENESFKKKISHIKKGQGLLVLPDPNLINVQTIKPLIKHLYRQGKVMIGYSEQIVRLGGIGSLYSTDDQYIQYVSTSIKQYQQSKEKPSPYLGYYSIAWNKLVSRSLNIPKPDESTLNNLLKEHYSTQGREGGVHEE